MPCEKLEEGSGSSPSTCNSAGHSKPTELNVSFSIFLCTFCALILSRNSHR